MKNAIKTALFKLRFKLSASNNFVFMLYYRFIYSPKKNTLESLLSNYSKQIGKTFTVVQIGANDGITHDPIHKFIKRDRWNGVLLEPQKFVFDTYLSKIYRKHANIHVLNAAMGFEDGKATIYKIGFSEARWATGLTTFDKKTLEKAFQSGHVKRKCAKDGTIIPQNKSEHIAEEKVRVISVNTLLSEYKIDQTDLLMIDTEGFDYEIIKMFDISKNKPGLIVFEHSHLSPLDYTDCVKMLTEAEYICKREGANTIAIKTSLNRYPEYFN